jgi:O-antigen/teichoic acid export membrane protein
LYFIGRLLPAAIAFAGVALYTRLLDPVIFGTYALVLSTLYLLGMVGYSWLRVATLRMMSSTDASEDADYAATIAIAFLGTSVLVSAAVVLSLRIWDPSLPLSIDCLAALAAMANNWFEMNVAIVISRIRLLSHGLLQAGRAIVALGATLLLILAGFKAQALLGGFVLGNCAAIGALGLWVPALRGRFRTDIFVRLLRFGWPASAASLSYCITTVQRYLLQIAGGSAAVGVLAAAGDFSTQTIGLLIGTAVLAGQPLAFRAHDLGHNDALREQLRNNARLTFAVGFAAAAGVIVLASSITHVYFGAKFRTDAATIVALTAAYVFIGGFRASYFEQAFEIVKNTRPLVVLTLLRIAACILASLFLIPRFGAIGAAISMLIAEIVTLSVSSIWAMQQISLPFPIVSIARIVLATGAMACVLELIPHRDSPLGLALAIVAGVLTYASALALMHTRKLRTLLTIAPRTLQAGTRP